MAHGNLSDLVFFALLGVVIQLFAMPNTLYEDIGPLKAQFKTKGADMDAIIKFGGGLVLMLGLTLSGVSWNPINGKMAGLGGFITVGLVGYKAFAADGNVFVPRLFYVYCGVILLGMLHIFAFPSNPLVPKGDGNANNHGNVSDKIAVPWLLLSIAVLAYPDHLFQDLGPIKAQFSSKSDDLSAMIQLVGGLMLILSLMLSGVKWNPTNGKMAGFGGFICAGYTAYSLFKADSDAFVPRLFYIYSALIFLGALHIFAFPSNPPIPKAGAADDKKKKK